MCVCVKWIAAQCWYQYTPVSVGGNRGGYRCLSEPNFVTFIKSFNYHSNQSISCIEHNVFLSG